MVVVVISIGRLFHTSDAAAENRRPLFCSEEQSAGVESTNRACVVVDMTVIQQGGSAADSAFVIENAVTTV